jgi:putative molybdopterin biosynthesis protein
VAGLKIIAAPLVLETLERRVPLEGGLEGAARQYGLGFVPLALERYDLLVWRRDYFEPPVQKLLSLARSSRFHARAEAHGGYDLATLGEVVFNG